jgi:branched-chain amino acid transport system permease protein
VEFGFLLLSILKLFLILGYLYGLLWALGHKAWWVKLLGVVLAYGIIQVGFSTGILTAFDSGLIFQASSLVIVSLGLNLIYGFNGQFSLGQWGFYGIGAYTSADITYRWANGDSRGLVVVLVGTILTGLVIMGVGRFLKKVRDVPVLSAFTLYILGTIVAWAIALLFARMVDPILAPMLGNPANPGVLSQGLFMQFIFFMAIILGGLFAAEISFLFGLPVLTLGSDYFGIATLGFTIVVNTLMINSDTILPFPEMRGGRGMLGIPQMGNTAWFWVFVFMLLVIVVMRNMIRSSTGRAVMSVREDETAAKAMGIDVAGTKLLAFVVGSLFAGIGGAVYTHSTGTGFLSPATFNFLQGFNPLIIIVFGGLGSMTGTIVASFGWIFFLEGVLRVLLGQMGTEAPTWRFVLYPITLLLLMLLRPQGLLGTVEWGFLKAKVYSLRQAATAGVSTPEPAGLEGGTNAGGKP